MKIVAFETSKPCSRLGMISTPCGKNIFSHNGGQKICSIASKGKFTALESSFSHFQQKRFCSLSSVVASASLDASELERLSLWTPDGPYSGFTSPTANFDGGAGATAGTGYDDHKPRTPPPDLPSLLLDSRIVYLGMPLVPAVTELIIAEMLYLQYKDRSKPIYLYINSTGTTRADGETVGFETEGTALYDTMSFIRNEVHTVGVGVAIGQACMLLSAGQKGKRFMLEHATAMLHQPRVPPTGQRQAIEIEIKWREVLAQKQNMLGILSKTTGHSVEKLDRDMQRPLYMQPKDALEYGIIDGIVTPEKQIIDEVKSSDQWDREAGLVSRLDFVYLDVSFRIGLREGRNQFSHMCHSRTYSGIVCNSLQSCSIPFVHSCRSKIYIAPIISRRRANRQMSSTGQAPQTSPNRTIVSAADTDDSQPQLNSQNNDSATNDEVLLQYVVLRKDLWTKLDWPLGSTVAQGCHAATAALWLSRDSEYTKKYCGEDNLDRMHKVVLEVNSEQQLLNTSNKLNDAGIQHKLWIEQPEDFCTCIATAPYPKSMVSKFFKKFKLCKGN